MKSSQLIKKMFANRIESYVNHIDHIENIPNLEQIQYLCFTHSVNWTFSKSPKCKIKLKLIYNLKNSKT